MNLGPLGPRVKCDRCVTPCHSLEDEIEGADWQAARDQMVRTTIEARGIHDPAILTAMRVVPRHEFVPEELLAEAHEDVPLPLVDAQTISQPYIVAAMAQYAGVSAGHRVLDVGTGSGYQAAVLAEVGASVVSLERLPSLHTLARNNLNRTGYGRISVHLTDGCQGWPEGAPYDAILVAAATPRVPEPLIDQLAVDGRLIVPVGDAQSQELVMLQRMPWGEIQRRTLMRVLFVPLVEGPL